MKELKVKISVKWWAYLYIYGVNFMSMLGMTPDAEKVASVISKGITVSKC